MEKTMFENYPPDERVKMFEDNCDGVEEITYYEGLSDEELIERRSRFALRSIDIARIKDKKKEANDLFKAEMQPLEIEAKELLDEIKTGQTEKEGRVYKMVNRDEGMVGYYTTSGNLVESRPGTKDELSQLSITGLNEAAK